MSRYEENIRYVPDKHVKFSVADAFADDGEPERYLTRSGGETPDTGDCMGALSALANAPSCTPADLDQTLNYAKAADRECSSSKLARNASTLALSHAISTHFHPDIDRCYSTSQLRARSKGSIPPLISSSVGSRNWWPAGKKMKAGSWRWSRDTLPANFNEEKDAKQRLEAVVDRLDKAKRRMVVVQQMIDSFLTDNGAVTLQQAAIDADWSIHPRTPDGHRNFLMVSLRVGDKTYATKLTHDESVHCDHPGLSDVISRAFTDDEVVTRAEWNAIRAMMDRTPKTEWVNRYDYSFRKNLGDEVSHEERLEWLGSFDCSA